MSLKLFDLPIYTETEFNVYHVYFKTTWDDAVGMLTGWSFLLVVLVAIISVIVFMILVSSLWHR